MRYKLKISLLSGRIEIIHLLGLSRALRCGGKCKQFKKSTMENLHLILKEKVKGISLEQRMKDLLLKKSTSVYQSKVDYLFSGFKTEIIWWHKGTKGRFSLQSAWLLMKAIDDLNLTSFIEKEIRGKQQSWKFNDDFLKFLKNN